MTGLENIRYFAVSDIGLRRKRNDDAYTIYDTAATITVHNGRGLLFAVADGLGGHACGHLASQMACRELKAFFDDSFSGCLAGQIARRLAELVERIDLRIKEQAVAEPACEDMATTLSALAITENWTVIGHVGDSRIYRLRKDRLEQLTSDHTFVQEMIDEGELTPESAASHPLRNMLTRALGTQEPLEKVDTAIVDAAPGDHFLLCSDGLHSMMSSETITAILKSQTDPKKSAEKLLQRALEKGGRDNVTIIVIHL
jgi:serine/threonine protein phosphatase PrpC